MPDEVVAKSTTDGRLMTIDPRVLLTLVGEFGITGDCPGLTTAHDPDMSETGFPRPLDLVLREATERARRMSDAALVLLVRYGGGDQLLMTTEHFPDSLSAGCYSTYATLVRETVAVFQARYQTEPGGRVRRERTRADFEGPYRAGWLLCTRAAMDAGYCFTSLDPVTEALVGELEELVGLADDPLHFDVAQELAGRWDGTPGALACAVRLAVRQPALAS